MADRHSVLDHGALVAAIERSADATTARTVVARVVEAHPEVVDELDASPLTRDGLVALACASRSLSSSIVADASMLDPLRDPPAFALEMTVDDYRDAWEKFGRADDVGLRRWKRRELLRTAARDLLGVADLPSVGRELAALAQVSLEVALLLTGDGAAATFAVIGMGKLGGAELNYSSDVDVLFVHDGDNQAADRVARRLLETMSTPTEDGIVFRTDADLRPEGRSGPLTRTLESYASYYKGWAQTWEFQSLLKARPVAGDPVLGARFMELIRPFVWPDFLAADALREIAR